MFRLSSIFCSALVAALLVAPAGDVDPGELQLADFAPTADYVALDRDLIVGRPNFTGLAPWVIEEIGPDDVDGPGDRNKSSWHKDPETLPERPIGDADYLHSGMSKGHFGAAANHKRTQAAIDASHDYWNAGPQEQSVNAQAWERTEERKRELRRAGVRVRSVVVPIFALKPAPPTDAGCALWSLKIVAQGPHQLWRPTHFATSIRAERGGRVWLENYLIANSADVAGDDINDHRVTCDEIERLTNLNLWPAPPQLKGNARARWLEHQEELEAKP